MAGFIKRTYRGGVGGRGIPVRTPGDILARARSQPSANPYPGVTPEDMGRDAWQRDRERSAYTTSLDRMRQLAREFQGWGAGSGGEYPGATGGGGEYLGGGGWGNPGATPTAAPVAPVAPIAPIAPVAAVAPVDTRAAQAAAFARAKDTVGQVGAGSIAALRSVLGGRGMLGSGNESRGVASVINAGQGQLGDVARSQAVQSADLAQRTAEANYTGQINQRGQDIGLAEANYSGQIGQRGQDLSAASERRRQDLADAESRRTLGFQAYESAQNRRDRLRQSSMDALRSLMAQVAPRY